MELKIRNSRLGIQGSQAIERAMPCIRRSEVQILPSHKIFSALHFIVEEGESRFVLSYCVLSQQRRKDKFWFSVCAVKTTLPIFTCFPILLFLIHKSSHLREINIIIIIIIILLLFIMSWVIMSKEKEKEKLHKAPCMEMY